MELKAQAELADAIELICSAANQLMPAEAKDEISNLGIAQSEQACVHLRQEMLPASWQPLTAWSVMMELYLAHRQGRRALVKHAILASGAPGATVLRHVKLLTDEGWITKLASTVDRRVRHLALTDCSVELIEQWLDARSKQLLQSSY